MRTTGRGIRVPREFRGRSPAPPDPRAPWPFPAPFGPMTLKPACRAGPYCSQVPAPAIRSGAGALRSAALRPGRPGQFGRRRLNWLPPALRRCNARGPDGICPRTRLSHLDPGRPSMLRYSLSLLLPICLAAAPAADVGSLRLAPEARRQLWGSRGYARGFTPRREVGGSHGAAENAEERRNLRALTPPPAPPTGPPDSASLRAWTAGSPSPPRPAHRTSARGTRRSSARPDRSTPRG